MDQDHIDQFAQRYNELYKPPAKKKTGFKAWRENTGWAWMNDIQKTGAIAFFIILFGSIPASKNYRAYFEVSAQTCLFLGWVAGSLWRVRHALHFWWSLLVAVLGHICLLSIYYRVNRYFDLHHYLGRDVATVIIGMIMAEIVLFLFILKKTALWLHRRSHPNLHMEPR